MFLSENRTMFVVMPLFDNKGMSPKEILQTKEEVRRILHTPNQTTFADVRGYVSLDPKGWPEKDGMYEFQYPANESAEPYYVAHRDIQLYDETLVTWGLNKVTQIFDMNAVQYRMVVLPDVFMVHLNHASIKGFSYWKRGFRNDKRNGMKIVTAASRWKNLPGMLTNAYYPPWLRLKAQDIIYCNANDDNYIYNRLIEIRSKLDAARSNVKSFKVYLFALLCLSIPLTMLLLKETFCC